jgi:hypothetical protein
MYYLTLCSYLVPFRSSKCRINLKIACCLYNKNKTDVLSSIQFNNRPFYPQRKKTILKTKKPIFKSPQPDELLIWPSK